MRPRIMFVFPPAASSLGEFISSRFDLCLGSAYIIAYLAQEGVIAKPFLAREPIDIVTCTRQILAENPAVVGFTVYDANYTLCQLIAGALKQANPGMIILFGGPTPSVQAETILRNNACVDICVRHEGEETCLELFTLLDNMNYDLEKAAPALETINGISFRQGDGVRENPGRDVLLTGRGIPGFLDKYPSPYLSGVLSSVGPGLLTARGCDRHCIFCNCAVMSKRAIATHSVDRVLDELSYIATVLAPPGGEHIAIYDDTFTMVRGRALEICRKIIENRIKLPLVCITRCDTVDEELLDTMKEAGFRSIGFSLESAVPRILRTIGKVQPPRCKSDDSFEKEKEFIEKFKKYTAYAKKIGINHVFASIIVGLPGETPREGQQTVDFIGTLGEHIDYYAHNVFKIYPGTPIFYNYKKYGYALRRHKNQVHCTTIQAYDTCKLRLAPKSNLETDNIKKDKLNMKTLALSVSGKNGKQCFHKIILCADIIGEELITWLRGSLAVNGPFIQIYSSLERARQLHRENECVLETYMPSTTFLMDYYQTRGSDGMITLTPFRVERLGERCGLPIDVVETKRGLLASFPGVNPLHTVCIDKDKEDVLQLHRLLVQLAAKDNRGGDWGRRGIFPYLSSLCRWRKIQPNCHTLETVIVDANYNVKTCWPGVPVGNVGMPFPEILENLKKIRHAVDKERDCVNCFKRSTCVKCLFPAPLPDKRYCDMQREFETGDTAELVRAFDFFKEL